MATNAAGHPMRVMRSSWHTRVSTIVFAWLGAAAAVAALGDRIGDGTWLTVHALLLGGVTNALFIWSWHFTGAILRIPQVDRADEVLRLVALNAGVGGVVAGALAEAAPVVLVGAAFVIAAAVLHARAIVAAMGRALPSPYDFTARAYVYSASLLVPGLLLGVLMESRDFSDAVEARLVLAHAATNLLGWVGIPILGTIVTLWPTMLRTRIAPTAARYGRRMLPVLAAATLLTATSLGFGNVAGAVVGLAMYGVAYGVTWLPMVAVLRGKPATSFATRSALAGMVWIGLTLAGVALALVRWGIDGVRAHGAALVVTSAAGGVLQVLIGCMAYLLPAMAAGGPAIVRLRNDRADRLGVLRLALTNLGLLWCIAAGDGERLPGVLAMLAGFVASAAFAAWSLRTPTPHQVADAEARRIWPDETV